MRLGYACQNLTLGTVSRTCRLANATPERVAELARSNLEDVRRMAAWNAEHGVALLRLTSGLVPFGGLDASGDWRTTLESDFAEAGEALRRARQRVSFHPGPFVALGSPRTEVVRAAVRDLAYHADALELLGFEGDIVVHAGGVHGDRAATVDRFAEAVASLPDAVRRRLVVENDDRVRNVGDVFEVARRADLPVVYDVLHDAVLPTEGLPPAEALRASLATWGDRRPKVHYSEQAEGKKPGAHAELVTPQKLRRFARGLEADIMVEAKGKERALLPLLHAAAAVSR